ncbi:MAG: hypothetical protein C5B49_03165, partial [Bdellovibrio sp.]
GQSNLYKLVQENWRAFEAQAVRDTGCALPDFVIREFEEYLRCGILTHGFLRAQCEKCHHEILVALNWKKRGFCALNQLEVAVETQDTRKRLR